DGNFAHNPEPLTKNLEELCDNVVRHGADIGISVDPDVDRLALFCEDGSAFGEENTQVAVADYILSHKQGAVATNISSSRALIDVAEAHGCKAYLSKVGEANVVAMLKEVNAVAGGEGNGGVIVPDFHYGRDALIGTALILSYLAQKKQKLSELKKSLPNYYVAKHKIELNKQDDALKLFDAVQARYSDCTINRIDGIRIDFEDERKWVILRASNTEPIIRIYAEAPGEMAAEALAEDLKALAKEVL
ncbi:MAG: phosphoglucosamine mutase, partial [Bacteroidales bacterium]|nr:phosphoglucosamine mutase [Bacteroidales bacterium]